MPSAPSAGTVNVHSAVLQALTFTVRSSTTSIAAVANGDGTPSVPDGQQPDAVGRVTAKNGLEVHFFAEAVDAAIGEDRSAQQRIRFVEIER